MTIASSLETSSAPALEEQQGKATRFVAALLPRTLVPLVLQIREDWVSHYRDASAPGFRAVAAHRFGTWVRQRSGKGLVRGPVKIVLRRAALTMFRYVRNHYGIELPHTCVLGRRVVVGHQSGIVIHPDARIGDDSIIRQNVTIGALNSDRLEAPVVGRRVELGAGCAILGPITIGDGSRIGPHSVVMIDVPPGSTVFVNPPRMITLKSAPKPSVVDPAPAPDSQLASAAR